MEPAKILDIKHLRMRKTNAELRYWMERKSREGTLKNQHFEFFFTTHFGLDREFYTGKRVLDVGCGPRGSLEWADAAGERAGLDPLVPLYRRLGTRGHATSYVAARAEAIPFPDDSFDVVSCFDALNHVDDLDLAVDEMTRVTAPGGMLLLLTEVNHLPSPRQPTTVSWEIVEKFTPAFKVLVEGHYEYADELMFGSIRTGIAYNHSDKTPRCGILSVKLRTRLRAAPAVRCGVRAASERMACLSPCGAAPQLVAAGAVEPGPDLVL